ncbi:D-alanine--D-alanine ligase family protein [Desulfonatronovibrio hydrogenovorans]|uniref:D-alanine--D-alanine ligase family protein n=1 Tax=Desulfonatronovibrio hydrogenovorans TaxID=53245 RepID=UPI00068E49B8|nr:hypothetical protein [Desulfonatronovibrio hydrogenovorans]
MQLIVLTSSFSSRARSDQADNLVQAGMVVEALTSLGHEVSMISATLDMESLSRQLSMLNPGLVFNLVEEINGRGNFIHFAPAVLESMNIPFTGNGHSAMVTTSDKLLAKKVMLAHHILTPHWLTAEEVDQNKSIKGGALVKSAWEHGSFGLETSCVFKDFSKDKIEKQIKKLRKRHGGVWFVEKYVPGREINVSILDKPDGPVILPVAEIVFSDQSLKTARIVGYKAKWNPGSKEEQCLSREFISGKENQKLIRQVSDIALHCWEVFEMSGYARVDFRVDSKGIPLVLEINANPCLSPDAGFMAAAQEAGFSPDQVIQCIVQSGLARYGRE